MEKSNIFQDIEYKEQELAEENEGYLEGTEESPEESYNFYLRIFLTNYLIYAYKLFIKVKKRGFMTLEDVPRLSKSLFFLIFLFKIWLSIFIKNKKY